MGELYGLIVFCVYMIIINIRASITTRYLVRRVPHRAPIKNTKRLIWAILYHVCFDFLTWHPAKLSKKIENTALSNEKE